MKPKPADWNKWMLIYNTSPNGTEYLSQSQYDFFVVAIKNKDPQVVLKDGRILPVWGARIRQNPEWFDPERIAKLREAILKREEYLKKKRDKELFDD